jgi:hypothetical protein
MSVVPSPVGVDLVHPPEKEPISYVVYLHGLFVSRSRDKPRAAVNFSEDRVNERLQAPDLEVLEKIRFSCPDEE